VSITLHNDFAKIVFLIVFRK